MELNNKIGNCNLLSFLFSQKGKLISCHFEFILITNSQKCEFKSLNDLFYLMAETSFHIRLTDTLHNNISDCFDVSLALICSEIRSLHDRTHEFNSKNMCPHAYRDHQQQKTHLMMDMGLHQTPTLKNEQ